MSIQSDPDYQEWYELIMEAKRIGLTIDEVRKILGITSKSK